MMTDNILTNIHNLSTSALFVYNLSTSPLFAYKLSTSALFGGNMNDTSDNGTLGLSVVKTLTSPPISTIQNAIRLTYILVSLFGVLGNLLSLIIICTHTPIRKRLSNYFFINQTIADLLVCILIVPSVTVGLIPYGIYATPLLCLLWESKVFFVGAYDVSVYSIAILSVERYLEVVYPIWHKLNVTKVKVVVTIMVIWIFGITFKVSCLLPTTRAVNGVCILYGFYPSALASSAAGVLNICVAFIFPLFTIFVCYIQMWRKFRNKVKPHSGPNAQIIVTSSTNATMSRARRNILTTLVIVVAFLIVCNSYKQGLMLLNFLHIISIDANSVYFNISRILSFMNATIEPYIYLSYHREFRAGFRKLFKLR